MIKIGGASTTGRYGVIAAPVILVSARIAESLHTIMNQAVVILNGMRTATRIAINVGL